MRPPVVSKYTHLEAGHERRLLFQTLCGRIVRHRNLANPDEATCQKCLIELLLHTLPRTSAHND